jgi:hypothetical protein
MIEHQIRLRGGWQYDLRPDQDIRGWITLPLSAFSEGTQRLRLIRSFQTPPLDLDREALWLKLDHVHGLIAVFLNDHEIARPSPGATNLCLRIEHQLPARNQLVLEVDTLLAGDDLPAGSHWGDISLLIRPLDDPAAGAPE